MGFVDSLMHTTVVVNQIVEQREEENLQELNDSQSYANDLVEILEGNVDINELGNNDLNKQMENLQILYEQHESQNYTNDPLQISEGNGDKKETKEMQSQTDLDVEVVHQIGVEKNPQDLNEFLSYEDISTLDTLLLKTNHIKEAAKNVNDFNSLLNETINDIEHDDHHKKLEKVYNERVVIQKELKNHWIPIKQQKNNCKNLLNQLCEQN